MPDKITVIGAGNVGATTAQRLLEKGLGDIVLIDLAEGLAKGKALDLLQSGPVEGCDAQIVGSGGYARTNGSAIVIITAGLARKPGMSRDDLLLKNAAIVREVTERVIGGSPEAILIVVSNPLDAMCHVAKAVSGFPRHRVLGMAGILDTARFRTFIAQELEVSVESVQACVLGGHGDSMVPLPRYSTVSGVPLDELIPADRLERIVERTRQGGAEIVRLLEQGSAFYAPSAAAVEMADSILRGRNKILPCSVHLEGEYGIAGLFVGVPVKLGREGMVDVFPLNLSLDEKADLQRSASGVQELVDVLRENGYRL